MSECLDRIENATRSKVEGMIVRCGEMSHAEAAEIIDHLGRSAVNSVNCPSRLASSGAEDHTLQITEACIEPPQHAADLGLVMPRVAAQVVPKQTLTEQPKMKHIRLGAPDGK